jgi:hypothetical protein
VASIILETDNHFSSHSMDVQSHVHFAHAASKILSIKKSFSLNSSFLLKTLDDISNKYEFSSQELYFSNIVLISHADKLYNFLSIS